jgi:hypothetical protein
MSNKRELLQNDVTPLTVHYPLTAQLLSHAEEASSSFYHVLLGSTNYYFVG